MAVLSSSRAPGRPVVCDDARAWARRAGRVPQRHRRRCRMPTLAQHTGLSRPTVSRLTYTLAQLGYLKRDAKGRFELGLGILAAAYPVLSALKVRQLARPLMRDFAAYAGGTVSIAMPFGLDFIYVETLRTTDAVPHVPDVGFTATMATTAVGRALLSLYTPDELQRYVETVKTERPHELDYVQTANTARHRALQGTRFCGFARRMAARDLWRRGAALPHAIRRLPVRQLRHSVIPFQRRADRARMRAAHPRPCPQHQIADGRELGHRTTHGASHGRCEKMGGENARLESHVGLCRGCRRHRACKRRVGAGVRAIIRTGRSASSCPTLRAASSTWSPAR